MLNQASLGLPTPIGLLDTRDKKNEPPRYQLLGLTYANTEENQI